MTQRFGAAVQWCHGNAKVLVVVAVMVVMAATIHIMCSRAFSFAYDDFFMKRDQPTDRPKDAPTNDGQNERDGRDGRTETDGRTDGIMNRMKKTSE